MKRHAKGVLAAALLLAAYLLPQFGPVREYALGLMQRQLAEAGYTLRYRASSGNLWHGLRLHGSTVYGPGIDVSLDDLSLRYTLPGLLLGKLPLSLSATGLSGDVTLAAVTLPTAPGTGGIQPVLHSATLSDVALAITDLPYTLPDLRLERLSIRPQGDAFHLSTTVTTADGAAELSATVSLDPLAMTADITRIDATIARHWWDGVISGTGRGRVTVQDGGVTVDLAIEGGSAVLADIAISEIAGRAVMRDLVIEADLIGRALDGPVHGSGKVDILQERWEATVRGEPSLAAAAHWLAAERIPDPSEPLALDGQAQASLSLAGWQTVTLYGEAKGSGTVLGHPLEALDATFRYDSTAGTEVTASGQVAGGRVDLTLLPAAEGFDLTMQARSLPLPGGLVGDADLWLEPLGGALRADIGGTVAGVPLLGALSGTYRSGDWHVTAEGRVGDAGLFGATGTLQGGHLEGTATISGLTLPYLSEPFDATLVASGPVAALPLRLTLGGLEPLFPVLGSQSLDADLRGTVEAILTGGELRDLQGALGPLEIAGHIRLSPPAASLRYRLDATPLRGQVAGAIAFEGDLALDSQGLSASAALTGDRLAAGPVVLPSLEGTLTVTEEGVSFTAIEPGLALIVREGKGALRLNGTRLLVADQAVILSGTAEAVLDDLAGATFALSAASESVTLQAQGSAALADLALTAAPGLLRIGEGVALRGIASLLEGRADLAGQLGAVTLAATAKLTPAWQVTATLSHGSESLVAELGSEGWALGGALPLAPLGELVDLGVAGRLEANLRGTASTVSGSAEVAGNVGAFPFRVALLGREGALQADLEAVVGGIPLTLAGPIFPSLEATLTVAESGAVVLTGTFDDALATGGGTLTLPPVAGLEIAAQPWTLHASSAERQAQLTFGASRALLAWGNDGWRLEADLAQEATWYGLPLALAASLSASNIDPEGVVGGQLALNGQPLTLTGTLERIALTGAVDVLPLAAAFGPPASGLDGVLSLDARLQPRDLSYALDALWHHDGGELAMTIEGSGRTLDARVQADGLAASFDGGAGVLALSAAGASLSPYLPLDGSLEGDLSFDAAQGLWDGILTVTAAPFSVELRGEGPSLVAELDAVTEAYRLVAHGPAFPALALTISAELPQFGTFAGTLEGSYGDAVLQGAVTVTPPALPAALGVTVNPVRAEVSGRWRGNLEALDLAVRGDAIDLRLQQAAWAGNIHLDAIVNGALHAVHIAVSGALDDPLLQGVVVGPYLGAEISGTPLSAPLDLTLTAQLGPWLPAPWPPLALSAEGTFDRHGSWQAGVRVHGDLAGLPMTATVVGSGKLDEFRAEGTLVLDGRPAPLELTGGRGLVEAAVERLTVDLGALFPTLPVALAGVGVADAAVFFGGGGLDYWLELTAQGTVADRPFALAADLTAQGLTVEGDVWGARVALRGTTERLHLELAHPEQLSLSAGVTLGERWRLQGDGRFRGEPLGVALELDPAGLTGHGTLRYGAATLTLGLSNPGAPRLEAALSAPNGLAGLWTAPLSATGLIDPAGLALELRTRLLNEPLTLAAAGPLSPSVALEGTLSWAPWPEAIDVGLERDSSGFSAILATQAFTLAGRLDDDLALSSWQAAGQLHAPWWDGAFDGDLRWQAEAGFSGQATVGAAFGEVALALEVTGDRLLLARGAAAFAGTPLGDLSLQLSETPWRDPRLAGRLRLDAQLDPFILELHLGGALELAGTLMAPQLDGSVQLHGAITAAGELTAGLAGAELRLNGPALSLTAQLDPQGWQLQAAADALPLEAIPLVGTVYASAEVVGSQRWGSAPHVRLADLVLRRGESQVHGALVYRGGWQGTLTVDLNLADLTPLRGRLYGPLTIGGVNPLAGAWQLEALGLPGADWGLLGTALLSGDWDAPQLSLALFGEGRARGRLHLTAEPRQAVLRGSGELRWGELGLRLEEGERELSLVGDGRLEGWRLDLVPKDAAARLSGNLASLGAGSAGDLALALTWGAEAAPWLSGGVRGGVWQGIALGDIALAATREALRLDGERISGALSFPDLSWQGRLNLALPAVSLEAVAAGVAAEAELSATLRTTLLGEPISLPLSAAYRAGRASLQADSPLLGGHVTASAQYADGSWQGAVTVSEVTIGGARLNANGRLAGPLDSLHLRGDLHLAAAAETQLRGTFEVGRSGVRVAQQLSSALLAAPLELVGTLAPQLELTVTHGDKALVISQRQGALSATGGLDVALPGAAITLTPAATPTGWLDVYLTLFGDAGLALYGTLPQEADRLVEPVTLRGSAATTGTLTVSWREPSVVVDDLTWAGPTGQLTLDGQLNLAGSPSGTLQGRWQGGPARLADVALPFALTVADGGATLTLDGPHGSGEIKVDWRRAIEGSAALAIYLGEGHATLNLVYQQARGPEGRLELTRLPIWGQGEAAVRLEGGLDLTPAGLSGSAHLVAPEGNIELSGMLGWAWLLPGPAQAGYLPGAADGSQVQARVDGLEVSALPGLSGRLPHLHAPVSGVVQLRDRSVIGQLISPELRVLDHRLPTTLELSGSLARLDARGSIGRSQLSASLSGNRLEGLLTLREFPLQVLAEAATGPTGIRASATGLARFSVPLDSPASSELRVASERLLLERDGVVTEGEVAFRYDDEGLVIETAEFQGDGYWQAEGAVTTRGIDVRLQADDANFTPLLGLFPALADWQVGARGSLTLIAGGTPAAPQVSIQSPSLDLAVSGTHYRLERLAARLEGGQFSAEAQLFGLAPVTGQLALAARGALGNGTLTVGFSGYAEVPFMGRVQDIAGELRGDAQGWTLSGTGYRGNRLTFGGNLNPLQLRLEGRRLTLSAPTLLVAEAEADVALALRYDDAFVLSGEITSYQTRLAAGSLDGEANGVVVRSPGPNPALERIRFDHLAIRAPQQVQARANIGSAELGLNLVLAGSAAQPMLQGEAQAIRGTFRFSGVDFTITQGVATFEAPRGIYPALLLRAEANFDKARALAGRSGRYEFAAPREGGSFQVALELRGEFEEVAPGTFRLVLTPTLSSNALLQEIGNGGAGPRPLTDDELLALLTIGRLEVDPQLAGSLVGPVAQTAIDTALDLFVLAELQRALSEALGVEVFELRTTALSTLFEGAGAQDFGVSLRVGGYLSEELFASFSVGRGQAYALSNEFNLRYDLGPLALSLRGGLNLLNDPKLTPIPEFGLSLGYALSPLASLEAGLGVSTVRQRLSFGVSLRW